MTPNHACWRFARMSPSQVNQDPVQGEFFTAAADLPDRLVRESIQNSLDARRGNETVRVRFAFSGEEHALPVDVAQRWLTGLAPHLRALASLDSGGGEADAMRGALDCLDQPMTWLTVGDSGTTGLLGDIRANREREARNDFWGFFRSVGISPKGEDSGGSWGLGKWVFPDASRINAYLGVTHRMNEDHAMLMGMAMLKTHHIADDGGDEGKYPPYGYFAAATTQEDDEWLPLPVTATSESSELVAGAIADFQLERRGDGPGLSVVVPYPRETGDEDEDVLTPATIARAVVIQYFLPIVRGDLEVEVVRPGEADRLIDATSIDRELANIRPRRDDNAPVWLRGAVDLARWAVGLEDDAHLQLPVPDGRENDLEGLDLSALRERFDSGQRLAFRLTLDARRRDPDSRTPVDFRVYLERDDDLPQGHDYFVRGQLRIPDMDHLKSHKARALVLVDGQTELGHLLRDAEGPAHASWDPHAQRLKDHWIGGYSRVQSVRRGAVRLLQRLAERPEEKQYDALADLFPSNLAAERGRGRTRRPGPGSNGPPVDPINGGAVAAIATSSVPGGFRVRAAPDADEVAGSTWSLRFAYDVARGGKNRAFRQFDQGVAQGTPDFSLRNGRLRVDPHNCVHEVDGENAVRLLVIEADFSLTVTGLDDRDVIIELEPAEEVSAAATHEQLT